MDGYEVKISYSPGDECYIAQIVEFTGCAVDGPTPEIALARLHEAKDEWVRLVHESGHPVPAPRYKRHTSAENRSAENRLVA